jgi:hypothetical protein
VQASVVIGASTVVYSFLSNLARVLEGPRQALDAMVRRRLQVMRQTKARIFLGDSRRTRSQRTRRQTGLNSQSLQQERGPQA